MIHEEDLLNYKVSVHGEVSGLQEGVLSSILSHHPVEKHVACHGLLVDFKLINLTIFHGEDILELW